MDVELTPEQSMLREATQAFLEGQSSSSRVRELIGERVGFDRSVWTAAAELGWPALLAPSEYGGAGLGHQGVVECAIIAEQIGQTLVPCPFLPVSVVVDAVSRLGSPDQKAATLPGLMEGTTIGTWAMAEGPGCWDTQGLGVTATRKGDVYVLQGRKRWVLDGESADLLLVTCRSEEGPLQLLIPSGMPGVTPSLLAAMDIGRRLADVDFSNVEVDVEMVLGDNRNVETQVWYQLALAVVLQCAESVGATERILEKTVAYARDRVAFGRPIGSFQAVKHHLAEAATWLEAAQAATWSAVRALADARPDRVRAVHVAKAFVSRHCPRIIERCMQARGGIAMTWEDDCHLYLRRVRTNAALFGTEGWHGDRLCDVVGMAAP